MDTKFNEAENAAARRTSFTAGDFSGGAPARNLAPARRPAVPRGRAAVWQARLVLLVMINLAQLWVLSAAVEAALAREFKQLLPLVIASGVCWLIALSIFLWWKPAPHRVTGYVRDKS